MLRELCSVLCSSQNRRGVWGRMDTWLCTAESLCCPPETVTALLISCECKSHSVVSNSLWPRGLYSPWNSSGQNTVVGCHSLLQGIFPTQGSNPGLPHRRWILYQLSHKESPRILEWVAYPFSRESSQTRNRTRVSCIAGRFFTSWATREPNPGWPELIQ